MANQRFSNRFLIVCLIAIIGLVLPNLVSSAVTPSVPGVSGEFNQPGPQKPKTGTGTSKAAVVYIITYDDIATDEQIQTFEQKLVSNKIDILYQYKELHGISVSMTAAQKKLIKDDPIIIGIMFCVSGGSQKRTTEEYTTTESQSGRERPATTWRPP
ncbi:hypothetical protein Pst134EB_026128 [Puccinia striiformis f. sp. tritici]|nr:hypothetical protein Pst134EB_026128 [Puccinia striiformis f. sp. tritici]